MRRVFGTITLSAILCLAPWGCGGDDDPGSPAGAEPDLDALGSWDTASQDAVSSGDDGAGVDAVVAPDTVGDGDTLGQPDAGEDADLWEWADVAKEPEDPDGAGEPALDALLDDAAPADAGDAPQGEDLQTPGDVWEPPDADTGPKTPVQVFGSRYWDVYRPAFLAQYFDEGRVTDRITGGVKNYGDTNVFMAYALSTFAYEYRAAGLYESLGLMHQILDAYAVLDALPANQTYGYLWNDPLDGYVYRSDRGPDYVTNWCQVVAPGVCLPDLGTHDNEPSGDQLLATLRGLSDVVDVPGQLLHEGVDLKALARAHAARIGNYLKSGAFIMKNPLGQEVKRGADQRWVSWSFQQGAARVSGLPAQDFYAPWTVLGLTVTGASQKAVAQLFITGAVKFTAACVSGAKVDVSGILGIPLVVDLACNEFNIGLGGDAAVISLSADPQSPDWFSNVVSRADLVSEGNALYAMYARYRFGDTHPDLVTTAARFLDAPATPPTGDDLSPHGWCRSWRWAHDFDDPTMCITKPHLFETYTGLDYMLPRAMASTFGEFPE